MMQQFIPSREVVESAAGKIQVFAEVIACETAKQGWARVFVTTSVNSHIFLTKFSTDCSGKVRIHGSFRVITAIRLLHLSAPLALKRFVTAFLGRLSPSPCCLDLHLGISVLDKVET
jgi:hypothetical protein